MIEREEMNELVPAATARTVAESAIDEQNLRQVAYAINSAANTGETEVVIMSKMTSHTVEELESNGYTIDYKATGAEKTTVVSWG